MKRFLCVLFFAASCVPVFAGPITSGNNPYTANSPLPVRVMNFPTAAPYSGSQTVDVDNFPTPAPYPTSMSVTGSVTILNYPTPAPYPTSVYVSNFPATQNVTVLNPPSPYPTFPAIQQVNVVNQSTPAPYPTGVNILNFPSPAAYPTPPPTQTINGAVSITNFPTPVPVQPVAFQTAQPVTINGTVSTTGTTSVSNFPAVQAVSPTGTFAVAGSVSVSNFPTPVPLQNVAITSTLAAKYTVMSTAGTYVIKNTPGVFLGVSNLSTSVQITAFSCYDNASAASGSLLINTALGLSPPWYPGGGVATNNGLTCTLSANLLGSGVAVYWR